MTGQVEAGARVAQVDLAGAAEHQRDQEVLVQLDAAALDPRVVDFAQGDTDDAVSLQFELHPASPSQGWRGGERVSPNPRSEAEMGTIGVNESAPAVDSGSLKTPNRNGSGDALGSSSALPTSASQPGWGRVAN